MIKHFAQFGMSVHVGRGEQSQKPCWCQRHCIIMSIQIRMMGRICQTLCCTIEHLFSLLLCSATRGRCWRMTVATMRKSIFASKKLMFIAKRAAYTVLTLSILLYGCESWDCLTEKLYNKLGTFHRCCVRSMSRFTRKQTRAHNISTVELIWRTGLELIDILVTRRQLRWSGHVSHMEYNRLPCRMLTSWVQHKRPHDAPQFTYGEVDRYRKFHQNIMNHFQFCRINFNILKHDFWH